MSSEPNKPIDRLLKAFAEKRRRDAGEPLELHPATRRMFRSAVAREYAGGAGNRSQWSRIFLIWLPRLAGAAVILACLGILGWALFQPDAVRRETDLARLSRDPEAIPSSPDELEKQAGQPSPLTAPLPAVKTASDSLPIPEPGEISVRDNVPDGSPAKRDAEGIDAGVPSRAERGPASAVSLAESRAIERPAPAAAPGVAVATKPQATLELAAAGGRSEAMKIAQTAGKGEARALADRRKLEAEARPDSKASGVGGVPGPGELRPKPSPETTGDGALASTRPSRDASLAKSTVNLVTENENLAKKDLSRGAVADAFAPTQSAVGSRGVVRERFAENVPGGASAVATVATEPPAGGSLARSPAPAAPATNVRAEFALSEAARPAEGVAANQAFALTQQLYFRQSLVTKTKAAAGSTPADDRAPLTSFSWQQNGRQLQVVDHDGSVYSGEWRDVQPVAPANQPSDDAAQSKGASSDRLVQYGVEWQAGQMAGTFRVVGTNRTLMQRVLFEGSLLREPGTAVEQRRAARESGAPAALAQPAQSYAFEASSAPFTNFAMSEARRLGGSLRIQAKATLGDGRVVPIDALEK